MVNHTALALWGEQSDTENPRGSTYNIPIANKAQSPMILDLGRFSFLTIRCGISKIARSETRHTTAPETFTAYTSMQWPSVIVLSQNLSLGEQEKI